MNIKIEKYPKSLVIYLVLIILAAIFLIAALIKYSLTECFWWDCAPNRDFSVYDLSIPGSLFPEGVGPLILQPDRGIISAPEEASGTLIWNEGSAIFIVKRFSTFDQAANWYFERSQQDTFTSTLLDTTPFDSILNFQSQYADQFSIDCGFLLEQISCKYFAQYQEYFIFFNGYVSEEGLTPENYLQIIQYIDETQHEKFGE